MSREYCRIFENEKTFMALKPCRECRKEVSTEAAACPSCGAPDPTRIISPKFKKSRNIYEDIWLYAEGAHGTVDSTYTYVTSQLDKESSFRIYSITGYFHRGIFEASCEHHNLEKKDYKKAIIFCFRQTFNSDIYKKWSDEQKDKVAEETYQNMENGLSHDDRVGKMCQKIIDTAKKSFKSDGAGCFSQLSFLWKDKDIYFSESGLRRNVGDFFKKLF
jgi:hypothetical protein